MHTHRGSRRRIAEPKRLTSVRIADAAARIRQFSVANRPTPASIQIGGYFAQLRRGTGAALPCITSRWRPGLLRICLLPPVTRIAAAIGTGRSGRLRLARGARRGSVSWHDGGRVREGCVVRRTARPGGPRAPSQRLPRPLRERRASCDRIRGLSSSGITPGKAGPFAACLHAGHRHGDECPAFLAAYRASIAERDHAIASTHRPPEPSPAEAGPECWAVHS